MRPSRRALFRTTSNRTTTTASAFQKQLLDSQPEKFDSLIGSPPRTRRPPMGRCRCTRWSPSRSSTTTRTPEQAAQAQKYHENKPPAEALGPHAQLHWMLEHKVMEDVYSQVDCTLPTDYHPKKVKYVQMPGQGQIGNAPAWQLITATKPPRPSAQGEAAAAERGIEGHSSARRARPPSARLLRRRRRAPPPPPRRRRRGRGGASRLRGRWSSQGRVGEAVQRLPEFHQRPRHVIDVADKKKVMTLHPARRVVVCEWR